MRRASETADGDGFAFEILWAFDVRFGPYVIGQHICNPHDHNCIGAAGDSGRYKGGSY